MLMGFKEQLLNHIWRQYKTTSNLGDGEPYLLREIPDSEGRQCKQMLQSVNILSYGAMFFFTFPSKNMEIPKGCKNISCNAITHCV